MDSLDKRIAFFCLNITFLEKNTDFNLILSVFKFSVLDKSTMVVI